MTRLLGPLGWRRQVETDEVIAWGIVKPVFFASARRPAGTGGGHVCFSASGTPAVKAAWEGGVASGGVDDGAPGNRPQYGPAYYSAYLRDPDGLPGRGGGEHRLSWRAMPFEGGHRQWQQ